MAAPISVEEYLRSSFSPDQDYVDGRLEERNFGEYDHATIQSLLLAWFMRHDSQWGTRTRVELRVQVSTTRFRVPDVCLMRRDRPIEQIVQHPPLVCIEVLSPDDSMHRIREKIADYHRMGVEHVWVLHTEAREALVCTPSGLNKPAGETLAVAGTDIYIPLAEIFAGLDEA